jgi:hypothetical protein
MSEDPIDRRIDDALNALGEDSDFIVKAVDGWPGVPHAVGLHCRQCEPDSETGLLIQSIGTMELWELIADAREHYDAKHERAANAEPPVNRAG